ncbi:hypothetical protein OIU78_006454 [Salix suchowensis]|nr:hypothetical protein OIU78_006454 [Salix suchowensis]
MKPPQNRLLLTAFLLLRCAMCTFSAKNCPNCGTTPVPYPFSTAPTCGDPQYKISSKGEAPCRAASICCTVKVGGSSTAHRIRVRDTGCRAYTSFVDLDPVLPVDKWSDPGLAIEWVLPQEPVCGSQADCDGNSTCGPAANLSGAGRCYCTGGLHWDPIQGICARYATCQNDGSCGGSRKTALIAGLTSGIGLTLLVIAISVLFYKRIRRIKKAQERLAREREEILNAGGSRAAKIFTGKQIKKATNIYVQRMVEEEKLMDVIDPVLKMKAGSLQIETVKALAFLALSCVEEKRQDRPSMKEVAEEIEYITTIATAREVEN